MPESDSEVGRPPRDPGDIDVVLVWTAVRAGRAVERMVTDRLAGHGLTPVQFGVLTYVHATPGLNQSQLARAVQVRPQSARETVLTMIDRGLLERQAPHGRGRRSGIQLTEHGRTLLAHAWPAVTTIDGPALGLAPGEDTLLNRMLHTVLHSQDRTEQRTHGDDDTVAVTTRHQRVGSGSPFEATIGFSRAVRSGDRVLVSGTAPVFPDGSCPDDAGAQARRCFEIISEALAAAGASVRDVIRSRVLLVDRADADAVSAVHAEIYADVRPAATMVVVAGLLDPRWKVEIEAEATIGG